MSYRLEEVSVLNFCRLSDAFSSYIQLQHHLRRMRSLASSDGVVYSASDTPDKLAAIFSVLCRMECALNELQSAFKSFLHLNTPIVDSVMDRIQGLLSSCVEARSRFEGMLQNVQLTSFPILLSGNMVSFPRICTCANS